MREATRFKATLDTVDVPARDEQVVENAVASMLNLIFVVITMRGFGN